jgi:hypothetical protein
MTATTVFDHHAAIDQLVAQGWTDEGIVFCTTGGTPPGR